MRTRLLLVLAGGALAATAASVLLLPLEGSTPPTGTNGAQESARPAPIPESAALERRAADPERSATRLLVQVVWADDGAPGVGIQVICWRPRDSQVPSRRVVITDASGAAVFDGVAPGTWVVGTDRGGKNMDAHLRADEPCTVRITLPAGMPVRGRVVDETDQPIRDAGVLAYPGATVNDNAPDRVDVEGVVIARTDGTGHFNLRGMLAGEAIGARCRGHAPAAIHRLALDPDAHATVVLQCRHVSGVLSGSIRNSDDQPLAGACIVLRWQGDASERSPLRTVRSDADGTFREDGMASGAWWVSVGLPGYCPHHAEMTVSRAPPTTMAVRLGTGASIVGNITDAAREPLAGIVVAARNTTLPDDALDTLPAWLLPEVRTDLAGHYEMSCLMPGSLRVSARNQDETLSATAGLAVADRETAVWNVVLAGPLPLRGTVMGPDGIALEHWLVQASCAETRLAAIPTNHRGEFEWGAVQEAVYRLEVMRPGSTSSEPSVRLAGVRPGLQPILIEVPAAQMANSRMSGGLLQPDGNPGLECRLLLGRCLDSGVFESTLVAASVAAGRFHSDPIPSGRYDVCASCAPWGLLWLGRFEVPSATNVDLGTHRYAEPGVVRVRVLDMARREVAGARIIIRRIGTFDPWRSLRVPPEGATVSLQPGTYRMETCGAELAMTSHGPVEVVAGRVQEETIVVPMGAPCILRLPAARIAGSRYRVTWQDMRGVVCYQTIMTMIPGEAARDCQVRIAPGEYAIEVASVLGQKSVTRASVRATAPSVIEVELP